MSAKTYKLLQPSSSVAYAAPAATADAQMIE